MKKYLFRNLFEKRTFKIFIFIFLFLLIFGIGGGVLAGYFQINVVGSNWKIELPSRKTGISRNGTKIYCNQILVTTIPTPSASIKGLLVKNSSGVKKFFMGTTNIYTSATSSYCTAPTSISNATIIKKATDGDVLMYVDNSGLHYKTGMCARCGNGIVEPDNGEECDWGTTLLNTGSPYDYSPNHFCYDYTSGLNACKLTTCRPAEKDCEFLNYDGPPLDCCPLKGSYHCIPAEAGVCGSEPVDENPSQSCIVN